MFPRREFSKLLLFAPFARAEDTKPHKFIFSASGTTGFMNTDGKTGLMNTDGTGLKYLDPGRPNQFGWGVQVIFKDGRRILLHSMEKEDWKDRSFYDYYHKIRTHLWIYDIESGALTEIADKQRLANFYSAACLLPGEDRMVVQVISENNKGRLFSMALDGTHQQEIVGFGQGFPYGATLNPDGKRLAFHLAGPTPHSYRVFTSDLDGSNAAARGGQPGHLYFGYAWSPDGDWILYQDCLYQQDPGHDWADICIGRPDGSERRVLTAGRSWFAAAFGTAGNPGGGSNLPRWSPDGSSIAFSRKLQGSKPPWEIQPQRPDTTHFNRDYKPEAARGGTEICLVHPKDGSITTVSRNNSPGWDFYPDWSEDGKRILFCRAAVGEAPCVWIMDSGGNHPRMLTQGINKQVLTHPH